MFNGKNFFTIIRYEKCSNCRRKFRRELAYQFCVFRTLTANAYGIPDDTYIICNKCANTKEYAKKLANDLYNSGR